MFGGKNVGQSIKTYIERIVIDLDCSPKEKRELNEELSGHLLMLVEEYQNKGFDKEKASALAIEEFGDAEITKEGLENSVMPEKKLLHKVGLLFFAVYSAVILWQLVIFRVIYNIVNKESYNNYFFIPDGANGFFNADVWKMNTNIIPFQSTYNYIAGVQNYNLNIIIENTLGNIAIFILLGILLAMLFRRFNTIGKVVMAGFILTVSIELTQFFLQIGRFDIDDIILNTAGAILGFTIYKISFKTFRFAKSLMTKEIAN